MIGLAVTSGELSEAERQSFNDIRERPRMAAMLNNFRGVAFIANAGGYAGASDRFRHTVLIPMRPYITADREAREGREQHAANVAASIAATTEKAMAEAAAKAEEDTREQRFLRRFAALPACVGAQFIRQRRKARAEAALALLAETNAPMQHARPGTYRSWRGNLVVRS
jgi:hypothetical protein